MIDLKGGGVEEETTALFAHLEKHLGKGKLKWNNFTHCGVEHVQDEKNLNIIVTDMDAYAKTLKPIVHADLKRNGPGDETPACAAPHGHVWLTCWMPGLVDPAANGHCCLCGGIAA